MTFPTFVCRFGDGVVTKMTTHCAADILVEGKDTPCPHALQEGSTIDALWGAIRYRDLVITLASRNKLPSIYWERFFVVAGGLISYGVHTIDQYRRAAGYVDRILKGEKPADLPVQAPNKYETVINLKTAKALDLSVPLSLQQRADEVIE
jgi:putative tryptophan/tyrosine transport system substrate-binding protein